jgi:hypothetical protein
VAYTTDQVNAIIAALEAGLAHPEHQVTFADRNVIYSSAAEIVERIQYFQRILDGLSGGRARQTFGVMTGKGF